MDREQWTCPKCGETMDARRCHAHSKRGEKKHCGDWAAQGSEVCRRHGAGAPQVKAKAERRRAEAKALKVLATFGEPILGADPLDQLMTELARAAGHVAWLGQLIGGLDHDPESGKSDLRQWHSAGEGGYWEPSTWVRMYGEERDRLTRVAKACIDAGIAERQVRIAEAQGQLVADVLRRVLDGVGVDPTSELARTVVRRELLAIEGREVAV